MKESLPSFRYHPEPGANGVIEYRHEQCLCCGKSRGAIYVGPVYATEDLYERICPWCIADGSAAAKFDAEFTDGHSLAKAGLPKNVIDEVTRRTPGFSTYQSEDWQSHCGDACEFRGDASQADIANVAPDTKADVLERYDMPESEWSRLTIGYVPRGDPAFYKFVCRHCGTVRLAWDCS